MAELAKGPPVQLAYELAEDPDGSPVVRIKGEVDMTTAPKLEAAVASIVADAPGRLVIDASELEFADSSAITLLVRWANLVRQIEVRDPPELLRRVITRMGLSDKLRMTP